MSEQPFIVVDKSALMSKASEMNNNGYLLTQICCTKKDEYDLIYTFERDYELVNLRVIAVEGDEIDSISSIYKYAFIYENEISDLFGINIRYKNIDFYGTFYRTAVEAPFNNKQAQDKGQGPKAKEGE